MTTTLPAVHAPAALSPYETALARAETYRQAAMAPRTRAAYASAARVFAAWCAGAGVVPLPASEATVAAYLAAQADRGLKVATIKLHVAAIAWVHEAAGHAIPTRSADIRAYMRGIRRTLGSRVTRKAPATADVVRRMLRRLPDTLTGNRDRALIGLGFAAALRRSELVALVVADLERQPDGLLVHLARSKTDQEGHGRFVAVPRGTKLKVCEAIDAWLAAADIVTGPLFRPIGKGGRLGTTALTDRSVADIVKARAAAAGLDPAVFSGHSLRAGFVTSALATGADLLKVMDVTGHTQVTTLKVYDRRARAFDKHAGKGFL